MSLKQHIEQQLRIPTRIKMGGPGSLDVSVDGKRIFSKKETGRMPQAGEIIRLIEAQA